MNMNDYDQLWDPAAKSLFGDDPPHYTRARVDKLERLLGVTCVQEFFKRNGTTFDFPMISSPKEATLVQTLRLLAGPHAKTVLKIYQIQKGLEQRVSQ